MVIVWSTLQSQSFDCLVVEDAADPEPETFCTEGQCLTIDQQVPYLQMQLQSINMKENWFES
jgi:hypothetical protein